MSVLPLDQVHGDHLIKNNIAINLPLWKYRASIDEILKSASDKPQAIRLSSISGKPVYEVQWATSIALYDGDNGKLLPPIKQQQIKALAVQHYKGDGKLLEVRLLADAPHEASGIKGPVWQANFADSGNTSLYLSAQTGQLLKVRSDLWRLFDFVWMLHIMDYDSRDNINNPLLIGFAATAMLFTCSGLILLWQSIITKNLRRSKGRI